VLASPPSSSPPGQRVGGPQDDPGDLGELLEETRILLPGTDVFLGFLMTLPFTQLFAGLGREQRVVYLCTFFATLFALVCFVMPAAYHRLARPIRHKERFKKFANRFLVAGLVPLSISMVLVAWLVTSVVMRELALVGACVVAVAVGVVWWLVPLTRAHGRIAQRMPSADPLDAGSP
jgi:hypothetical protein